MNIHNNTPLWNQVMNPKKKRGEILAMADLGGTQKKKKRDLHGSIFFFSDLEPNNF